MSHAKRILIVEDEALIALDMESSLSDLGHAVEIVASLREADELVADRNYDLVVLDFHLSDGDAGVLVRALHGKGIPFVICSGTAAREELVPLLAGGTFLPKPFSNHDLITAVQSAGRAFQG